MSMIEPSTTTAPQRHVVPFPAADPPRRLHRIQEVRQEQGMSLRSAARHLGVDIRTVRRQESPSSELTLSQLYAWQAVLEVPLEDLLVEPQAPLSRPIRDRARMVRVMKTAVTLLENSETPRLRRIAENLIAQLLELMPELDEVHAWHAVGQRRTLDEVGRCAERRVSEDLFQQVRFRD